jgi:hypothetical protein
VQSTVVVNAQADARPSKAGNIATLGAHYMIRMPGSAQDATSVAPDIWRLHDGDRLDKTTEEACSTIKDSG